MPREYTIQTAGFHKVHVLVTPDDYHDLSPENLARAEQMIREMEILRDETFQLHHKDWGQPIGVTSCVQTRPDDTILYARLKGRDVWGRFVFFREPESTSHLFINVKLVRGVWRLTRVYCGEHAPAFPGDPHQARNSRKFWSRHALLWDAISTQRDTQPQVECPW